MALNQLGLGFIFTAKDEASRVMKGVQGRFVKMDKTTSAAAKSFKSNIVQMGVGVGLLAAGLVTLGASFSLARSAGVFQQELVAVGQISRGTAKDMELLRDAALEAGLATRFSPTEAVAGLRVLSQAGLSAAESIRALRPVLDLATGGNISIEQSANTAVAAMNAFKLGLDELTFTSDQLFRATQQSTLQMSDMQLAIGNVARGASLTNQELGEMLNTMGLIKDTGVDVSTASTAVTRALSAMAAKRSDLKKLGVEVTDADGNFRKFTDVIIDLNEELNERFPNAAERTDKVLKIFGQRGVAAFTGTIAGLEKQVERSGGKLKTLRDAVQALRDGMADSAGTTTKFVDAMLDTFEGQKTLLTGALQTIQVLLGEGFARVFKPVVGIFVQAMTGLASFINGIPDSTKDAISKFVLALGAILTILGGLITAKAGLFLLILGIKALLPLVAGLAAPFLIVTAAVAALVLVFVALRERSRQLTGETGGFFADMAKKVGLAFKAIVQLFSKGEFSGEVLKELNDGQGAVKEFAITAFLWFNRIKAFFAGVIDGFREGIQLMSPVFDLLLGAFNQITTALGFTANGAETNRSIWATFAAVGNVVGQVIAAVAATLAGPLAVAFGIIALLIEELTSLWDDFGFLFSNVGDSMKAVWNGVVSFIIAGIRALLGPLESIARFAGFGDEIDAAFKAVERAATFNIAGAGAVDNPAFPAGAQTSAITGATTAGARSTAAASTAAGRASNSRPVILQSKIDMNIDGERFQSVIVSQQRLSQSRSLLPVPATEGAGG